MGVCAFGHLFVAPFTSACPTQQHTNMGSASTLGFVSRRQKNLPETFQRTLEPLPIATLSVAQFLDNNIIGIVPHTCPRRRNSTTAAGILWNEVIGSSPAPRARGVAWSDVATDEAVGAQ